MDDYLVSIIMPSYNAEHTISASISSVLKQTYANWELLVCDDDSSDNTRFKVLEFSDSRIKLLTNEYAKGAAGARNTALKYASGRFIAFLDSDDIWIANKLEMQISMMLKNNISFMYGNYEIINNNSIVGKFVAPQKITYNKLLKNCGIGCLTVVLDKTLLNPFSFPFVHKEDYYLWLSILKDNNISAINCGFICSKYRLSQSSISSNKFKELKRQWDVLGDFVENPLARIYYLLNYIVIGIKKHAFDYKNGKK